MDHIFDYTASIMDIAHSLLENSQLLNNDQVYYVKAIYQRADDFIAAYLEKQYVTIQELRRYLSHDARTPLTVIIGCCDLLLSNTLGDLHEAYREALVYIRKYAHGLHSEIQALYEEVWGFMQTVGIEK